MFPEHMQSFIVHHSSSIRSLPVLFPYQSRFNSDLSPFFISLAWAKEGEIYGKETGLLPDETLSSFLLHIEPLPTESQEIGKAVVRIPPPQSYNLMEGKRKKTKKLARTSFTGIQANPHSAVLQLSRYKIQFPPTT